MARHDRSKSPPLFLAPPRDIPSPKGLRVSPGDVPVILWNGWKRIDRPMFAIDGWGQGWAAEQNAGAS